MGGKKQGVAQFYGSLKTHWMMYINAVDIKVNPRCVAGIGMNTRLIKLISSVDSKFIQPGFQFNTEFIKAKSYYQPSLIQFKFVNGYEKVYNPQMVTFTEMLHHIKEVNRMIEFERSMQGQDDELDDDM